MERLELYVSGLLLEHVHHKFEVVRVCDIPRHDGEVMPVQQQLPEQLEALPSRHVVLRVQQPLVVAEYFVVVRF